jgi:hypothetical protein
MVHIHFDSRMANLALDLDSEKGNALNAQGVHFSLCHDDYDYGGGSSSAAPGGIGGGSQRLTVAAVVAGALLETNSSCCSFRA